MIIYVDMDDTICDYKSLYLKGTEDFPQSRPGFFKELQPIKGALETLKGWLLLGYEVYILTRPSIKNLHCYSEKAWWINNYIPELLPNLIICSDKSLLRGHILVDDMKHDFKGYSIQYGTPPFNNWAVVDKTVRTYALNFRELSVSPKYLGSFQFQLNDKNSYKV